MAGSQGRRPETLAKVERVCRALRHEEPDRVPIGEFYWGAFVERWRRELGIAEGVTPYAHYDLDWIVANPNLDPWVRPFETLRESADEVTVRTGFGAVVRKVFALPMPEMRSWEIDTLEKLEAAEFDDPRDPRRYCSAGDNHLAGAGDTYQRDTPAWVDTVRSLWPDFAVYGGGIEVSECLTRMIGQEHALLWMGMEPERMARVIHRIGEFYIEAARATMDAVGGLLDGFVIWGDVAYKHSLLFSPAYWREHFRPCVAGIVAAAHERGIPVIYHSCGNVRAIIEDLIEVGVDALNPLEAKAGLDAVELRKEFGHRIAFCGNSDIRVWESGDEAAVRHEVLRKLAAARGGGMLFQSDHSVSTAVSGRTYDLIVRLVREHGRYPLELGEYAV